MSLDQMAVGAQDLDVIALSQRDLSIEGHSVFDQSLVVPSTVDVVELKNSRVFDSAAAASTPKPIKRLRFPFALSTLARLACQLITTIWMRSSPSIDGRLLAPVDASPADVAAAPSVKRKVLDRTNVMAGSTLSGFHGFHVRNRSIRKSVDYDSLMGY